MGKVSDAQLTVYELKLKHEGGKVGFLINFFERFQRFKCCSWFQGVTLTGVSTILSTPLLRMTNRVTETQYSSTTASKPTTKLNQRFPKIKTEHDHRGSRRFIQDC